MSNHLEKFVFNREAINQLRGIPEDFAETDDIITNLEKETPWDQRHRTQSQQLSF